ncbi:MAG: omega-amidase [Phenylobacterium sp.]
MSGVASGVVSSAVAGVEDGAASELNITLVQTDISWLAPAQNLARLSELLAVYNHSDDNGCNTDLIVLPETFATGFAFDQPGVGEADNGPIVNWLQQTAQATGAVVVGSVAVHQGDKNANRLYWVKPDGEVLHYDKRHLFRMGGEHHHVVAGDKRQVFDIKGVRFLPLVCYDLRFPVWSRNKNDYDVLLNIANWPGARRRIWDVLLQARAMENQCYVVAVNRVGDDGKGVAHSGGSAVYDFKGDTLAIAADNQSEIINISVDITALNAFKQQFPAYLDGDDFELLGRT